MSMRNVLTALVFAVFIMLLGGVLLQSGIVDPFRLGASTERKPAIATD